MSSRRSELWILIALLAILAGPARAAADGFEVATQQLSWTRLQSQLGIRAQTFANDPALADLGQVPVIGCRAVSGAWSGLKLWASGTGFEVGRRSAGYGVQGGAALPLEENIDLTAGYRVTGFSLGSGLDTDLADVDNWIAAPFVGVALQF